MSRCHIYSIDLLVLNFSPEDLKLVKDGLYKRRKIRFYSVKPCYDSVCWSNEADMDPDVLYENSIPYKPSIPIQS